MVECLVTRQIVSTGGLFSGATSSITIVGLLFETGSYLLLKMSFRESLTLFVQILNSIFGLHCFKFVSIKIGFAFILDLEDANLVYCNLFRREFYYSTT